MLKNLHIAENPHKLWLTYLRPVQYLENKLEITFQFFQRGPNPRNIKNVKDRTM